MGCVAWLYLLAMSVRALRVMPRLDRLSPPDPPRWPKVSIVVPACNEVDTVEVGLRSKLAQDYPELELVAVDDRSTDGTGGVIDRLAAEDPRVVAVHLSHLPAGWLGKVHALSQGVRRATGEWILMSDADVRLAKNTVRQAVAWAEWRGLDFLAATPHLDSVSFAVDIVLSDFVRTMLPVAQTDKIEDPASPASLGAGLFNLVRRAAYEKSPGLEHLKLEVADDVGFGQMMKASGARCSLVNGNNLAQLAFYSSMRELTAGLEKAWGTVGRCSARRLIITSAVMLFVHLSPFLALLPFWPPWLRLLGAVAVAANLTQALIANLAAGRRMLPALLAPLGAVVLQLLSLRAGWLGVRRGGLVWRGTLYPNELLRSGMRWKMISLSPLARSEPLKQPGP